MAKLRAGVTSRPGKKGTAYQKRFTVQGQKLAVTVTVPNTDTRSTAEILRETVYPELDRLEQEKRKKIEAGAYKINDTITVTEYFEEVQKEKLAYGIKENTIYTYKIAYYHNIAQVIGKERLVEVDARKAQEVYNKILSKNSKYTAKRCLIILRNIFEKALKHRMITYNPFKCVDIALDRGRIDKAVDNIHKAFNEEEVIKILPYIKKTMYYNMFRLLFLTGMRCGEVCSLRWEDIDYQDNVIHIKTTVTKDLNGKSLVGSPKTPSSYRDIPLTNIIKALLETIKEQNKILGKDKDQIFYSTKGKLILPRNVSDSFRLNIMKYNDDNEDDQMTVRTIHATRDTWATLAQKYGMPERMIEDCLGHSKNTIFKLYAQNYFKDIYEAANKLDFSFLLEEKEKERIFLKDAPQ